jgi:hypothetical protein
MLCKAFALVSLALLASSPVLGVVAEEDWLNYTDILPSNVSIPCLAEVGAWTLCNAGYNCTEACPQLDSEGEASAMEITEAPFDPTNMTALKEFVKKGLEEECATSSDDYCVYKGCCPGCADQAEAVLKCYFNKAIPLMQDAVEDLLGSAASSVGGFVDTLLLAANEISAGSINETLAPTTGWGNMSALFSDLFGNYTCDIAAFDCTNATRV